jgi:hypothetical protein
MVSIILRPANAPSLYKQSIGKYQYSTFRSPVTYNLFQLFDFFTQAVHLVPQLLDLTLQPVRLLIHVTVFSPASEFFGLNGQLSSLLAESVGLIPATFLLGTFCALSEFSNSTLHLLGPVCRLSALRLTSPFDFDSFRIGTRPFGHPSFTEFVLFARHTSSQFRAFLPPALSLLLDLTGNSFGLLPEFVGLLASILPLGKCGRLLKLGKISLHPFQLLCPFRRTESLIQRSFKLLGLGPHSLSPLLGLACFHSEFFNPFSCLRELPKHCLFIRTDETILIPVELMLQVRLDGHSFLTG